MKLFFDPVIQKIKNLINGQLNKIDDCSAMFLVGGFSESKYLQIEIKNEFRGQVSNISVPRHPALSVVKGAVEYGLDIKCIKNRVAKSTYGVKMYKANLMDIYLSEIILDIRVPDFYS